MNDTRLKIAAALLVAVLSTLGVAHAAAATGAQVQYACDARQHLVVMRSAKSATVQFIDRTYELRRKPSAIGERYISKTAALIIDGPSAVFVAEDRLQLGSCVEVTSLASK